MLANSLQVIGYGKAESASSFEYSRTKKNTHWVRLKRLTVSSEELFSFMVQEP